MRTFTLKTTGAVPKEVKGEKGDGRTGLLGQCNPTMFANFGIERGRTFEEQIEVTLVSRNPIPTGATGEFELNKLYVRFHDLASGERNFGGPGTLKLSVHDASLGKRRMVGTMTGTKLEGLGEQKGKTLDVTASFDMDSSCGVK